MKKWLWYGLIIAAVAVFSGGNIAGKDVGKLQPVQVVRVAGGEGQILLETDTQNWGYGENVDAAIKNMKKTASGEIFLDTADYLLIAEGAEKTLPDLMDHLRPSCAICKVHGTADLAQVGQFFEVHAPKLTLADWRAGEWTMPVLISEEGRMELVS